MAADQHRWRSSRRNNHSERDDGGRTRSGAVIYELSLSGCSKTVCWVLRKPSVHAPFRASLFVYQQNQRIIQARTPYRWECGWISVLWASPCGTSAFQQMQAKLSRGPIVGFGIMFINGFLLLLSEPMKCYNALSFRFKVVMLVLACLKVVFSWEGLSKRGGWDEAR